MASNVEKVGKKEESVSGVGNSPFVAAGLAGWLGLVAYAVNRYRKRKGTTSTSLYVIQTRVYAQVLAVGLMSSGVAYHLYTTYVADKKPKNEDDD